MEWFKPFYPVNIQVNNSKVYKLTKYPSTMLYYVTLRRIWKNIVWKCLISNSLIGHMVSVQMICGHLILSLI